MEFSHPYYLLGLVAMPIILLWYLKKGRHEEASIRYSNIEFIPKAAIRQGEWNEEADLTVGAWGNHDIGIGTASDIGYRS